MFLERQYFSKDNAPSFASPTHSRFFYRDIKPQNFLYVDAEASDDALRVVDFGLAMPYIPGDEGLMLTKRAGTPAYMAPELVLRRYNEKVDLW